MLANIDPVAVPVGCAMGAPRAMLTLREPCDVDAAAVDRSSLSMTWTRSTETSNTTESKEELHAYTTH